MQPKTPDGAQGIDVSHWQGSIDWNKVKVDGKHYAFIKATEGTRNKDAKFIFNIKGAKAAGLLVGAYHFLNATSPAVARQEANHFVQRLQEIGGANVLDFPPVLDYENNPGRLDKSTISAIARAFLEEVERLTEIKPMIYTGNAFAANFDTSLSSYSLWIARYSTTRIPDDCTAWKSWDFWQYSDSGYVRGIGGNVDLNIYKGTLAQLISTYGKKPEEKPTDKGDEPMTAEEKKAFQALEATVKAQAERIAALTDSRDLLKTSINKVDTRIQRIEQTQKMDIPTWAKEAVSSALATGVIQDPEGGSYDFYRLLTVLHRKGLI